MKEDTKKSAKPAAKSQVKVKDLAPKKDAKGGFLSAMHSPVKSNSVKASSAHKNM